MDDQLVARELLVMLNMDLDEFSNTRKIVFGI